MRDWVLVPLTLSVVLMMVLRQYITKVGDLEAITNAPACARACWQRNTSIGPLLLPLLMCTSEQLQLMASNPPPTTDAKELAEKQQLVRSQLLRTNLGFLPESAFRERRHYFTNKVSCWEPARPCWERGGHHHQRQGSCLISDCLDALSLQETGVFNQKSEAPTPQEMMMSNPDMMMNMMKGNITGFLPQVLNCACMTCVLHVICIVLHRRCDSKGVHIYSKVPCDAGLQIAMGMFVNYFFAGFILGKVMCSVAEERSS